MKLDHVGIAVKDLTVSNRIFEKLFKTGPFKQEEVASQNVKVSFFRAGESKVELLEPTAAESPIAKFIDKKGEGMHHLAFLVEDIYAEIQRMKQEGFQPLSEEPRVGANNKLVCFFHPKDTNGVLIEICQEIK
jgi:methylmalonyl-CoA/ethylmalonyl-CoA epimerase